MKKVKEHFEEEADEFDKIANAVVPFYDDMIESIAVALPFDRSIDIKIADLGCGTGNISYKIKRRFPNARITCIDFADNMIDMAKIKLAEYNDIIYYKLDFRDFRFDEDFDAVVSSLAIHHLTNDDKKSLYRKIYHTLRSGGVFYNADNVLGSNHELQDIYMTKWKEFMMRKISLGEIEEKWLPKHHEEDIPAKMIDQLDWLRDIGFKPVDVIWKNYYFAVYGGFKP